VDLLLQQLIFLFPRVENKGTFTNALLVQVRLNPGIEIDSIEFIKDNDKMNRKGAVSKVSYVKTFLDHS